MLEIKEIKNIAKVGITLFLITAISAFVLAAVNEFTAPVIAENIEKKRAEAMKKVLPEAIEFSPASGLELIEFNVPVSAYKGVNNDGETVGYAVMVSPKGYGGEISMAVGIDNNMKVTGIDIISQSETPSLGAKCTNEEFKEQFKGKSAEIDVVKTGAEGNQVDAITSATITSKAVTHGVNLAIETAEIVKEAE